MMTDNETGGENELNTTANKIMNFSSKATLISHNKVYGISIHFHCLSGVIDSVVESFRPPQRVRVVEFKLVDALSGIGV